MDLRTALEGTCRHYCGIGAVGRGETCEAGVSLGRWPGMLPCYRGELAAAVRRIGRFKLGPEPEPCPLASFRTAAEADAEVAELEQEERRLEDEARRVMERRNHPRCVGHGVRSLDGVWLCNGCGRSIEDPQAGVEVAR